MTVTLRWNAVTGANSYNVYRTITSGSGYQLLATNLTQTSYVDGPASLEPAVTYYYHVTAVNTDGESLASAEVPATAPALPAAPTGLTASVV